MASALVPSQASPERLKSSPGATKKNNKQRDTPLPRDMFWNRTPWCWLASLRIGLVLLLMLTIASIIGTAIDPLERAQAVIFYSWWYKLLLLALSINMTAATLQTISKKLIPSYGLRLQRTPSFYQDAKPNTSIPFNQEIGAVAAAFRQQGCQVFVDGDFGVARRGWISKIGGPISHVGLVIVLGAGFASSWVAREAWVRIPEGRAINQATMRDKDKTRFDLGFTVMLDDFSTGFFPRTRVPSHFESHITARSASGEVLYRGPVEVNHSPFVGGWYLHQTSYEELPNQRRQMIDITAPGASEPVSVELSAGQPIIIPGHPNTELVMEAGGAWKILSNDKIAASGIVEGGHSHGDALSLRVERYEPDFVFGANREITSRSQEPNNPAIQVTLLSDGTPALRQWLFQRPDFKQFSHNDQGHFQMEYMETKLSGSDPVFVINVTDGHSKALIGKVEVPLGDEVLVGESASNEEPNDYMAAGWTVAVGETAPAYATVLTMTRNPILPIVYIGCGLMMIGLFMGFFIRRREVWFMVKRDEGKLCLVGRYRHSSQEIDPSTRAILARLQTPEGANA